MAINSFKISVIVPVYNVEKYLPRCIESILAQTFTNFEPLLIDDGSKDQSGKICDEYAKKDNRIRVFHKENGGVSSARNIGLENAKGEWLAFIDADDKVDAYYLTLDENENADVIEKGYEEYDEHDNSVQKHPIKKRTFSSQEDFFRLYVNKRNNALWNKIIRRSLTEGYQFNTNVYMGEDFLFFIQFIHKIRRYKYSNIGLYFYYKRSSSATGIFNDNIQKRISVLWENMHQVRCILSNENLYYLCNGIIYNTYVSYLYGLRKFLIKKDIERLKYLFKEMNFANTQYICLRRRCVLFVEKIIFCRDSLRGL